jgi:hypothetical protein
MYIDVVINRNSPPAILLREARRQGKKIVKVTLANLSYRVAIKRQFMVAAGFSLRLHRRDAYATD